ncbi:MAG: TylF/MycF/NovP-related O-methyltransferase [Planctomycetota bacterium]
MLRTVRENLKACRRGLLMKVPKLGFANLTALWWQDRAWMTPYRQHLYPDGRAGTRMLARRFMLIQLANSVSRLEGSTAECGVARGTGSAVICETLRDHYRNGDHHFAFDSFEGVSEPGVLDNESNGKTNWYKGKLSHDYVQVRERLQEFSFCQVVKGWIPDCFEGAAQSVEKFRFVHIDVDLYEPTKASLEFFVPRLVPGGIIVFDDHGFRNCPGARKAAEDYFADRPEAIVEMTTAQAFVTKAA